MKEDLSREEAAMVELRGGRCGGGGLRELDLLAFVFFFLITNLWKWPCPEMYFHIVRYIRTHISLPSIYTMNA